MEVLGHSQISLTLDTYSHVTPQPVQDAATAMTRSSTGTGGEAIGVDVANSPRRSRS